VRKREESFYYVVVVNVCFVILEEEFLFKELAVAKVNRRTVSGLFWSNQVV
jgi:hypothetical protein